jgi:hypothetical protein
MLDSMKSLYPNLGHIPLVGYRPIAWILLDVDSLDGWEDDAFDLERFSYVFSLIENLYSCKSLDLVVP